VGSHQVSLHPGQRHRSGIFTAEFIGLNDEAVPALILVIIAMEALEVANGKLLNNKTKLGVVWIVYDPRWTPSFNNFEKTHFFLPCNRSLELCQTEQQDNIEVDGVKSAFSRMLQSG